MSKLVFAREHGDNLVFLCDRCGVIHRHGNLEGNRVAHCTAENTKPLGDLHESYRLLRTAHKLSSINEFEGKSIYNLLNQAHRIIDNCQKYLGFLEIDELEEIMIRLSDAELALREIIEIRLYEKNLIERLTTDDEYDDEGPKG